MCIKTLGYWEKNLKLSKSIEQKANAIQQDVTTIKEGQQDIKNELETLPEKTAAKVVKAMVQPMKDEAGNIMDCTKEQADRLERNIPMVITEQIAAQLAAYFGPVPHPGEPSSTSKIDRSINHAVKLRVGAENAAKGAAKAKAKARAKPKAKAKANKPTSNSSSSSNSSNSSSEDEGVKINTPRGSDSESDDAPVSRGT